MRVRFLERYTHKPTPTSARTYPPGSVDTLPTDAAQKAIAAGKAIEIDKDGNDVEAGKSAAPEAKPATTKAKAAKPKE